MATADPSFVEVLRKKTPAMLDHLALLVNAESGSSDLEGIAACAGIIEEIGADITGRAAERVETEGRVHLVWRFGSAVSSAGVLLVGHFDTVWPRGTLDRWPFTVEGERASGPGAFDMKAGIVQMFHALEQAGLPDGVTCVLTSDEELGSQTSRSLVERLATGASAALVLEPSVDGALKLARKGTSMYEIAVEGRAAHAGLEPEKGANATVELAHQIIAVTLLGRADLGTTVTPTVATGGTTTNTVPSHAAVQIDVRAESSTEQERVDAELRGLRSTVDGTRLVVSGGPNRPPFPKDASASLFRLARQAAAQVGLGPPRGEAVGGGSDGNFTAGIGVPTLDGLGAVGGKAHADGEWVHVPSMAERAALLAQLLILLR
ncbi:MAG TPA: M20 family metallopeptidase [Acidimicrobiales bacterium]|nr:M20 family metallopeptidase [Acidimicrobiales bacterium]